MLFAFGNSSGGFWKPSFQRSPALHPKTQALGSPPQADAAGQALAAALVLFVSLVVGAQKTLAGVPAQTGASPARQEAALRRELRRLPLSRNLAELPGLSSAPASAPSQPAAQPAPPARPVPIGFRLQNADLLQVINLIAGQLKLNYVVDPGVKGTVTINTAGELRREDLLPILETILKMNGATAIRVGNFYRILPLAQAAKSAVEVYSDISGKKLAADDQMVMEIIPLRFVAAGDMGKILSPFLSDGGSLAVHETGNVLILEDNSLNVKRLMEILAEFDNPDFAAKRVQLIPVRNNLPSSLVPELDSVFAAYALSDKATPLHFVPIDRLNAILAVAPDPSDFTEVEKWVAKLDAPAAPSAIQTFIYPVANSEADYLAKLLGSIYSLSGGAPVAAPAGPAPLKASAKDPPAIAGLPTVAGGSAAVSGSSIRVISDIVNNSLIIQCTAQQYADILDTLKKIDILPRQVLIDAKVYEVDLTGDLSFGLSYFLQERTSKDKKFLGSFSPTAGLAASTGTIIGGTRELLTFLNASENRSRIRILSEPSILATDNSEARIQVGSEIPILTSQGVIPGVQAGASSVFTNTITNRDTGVILNVTPRITSSGMVALKISQEISSAVPPAPGSGIQSPSITKRDVVTHAVVQNGETVALGGMIQRTITVSRNRVPFLGDIPGLGVLFGQTSRNETRTELVVLLTPNIVPDVPAARARTEELENKLRDLRRGLKEDAGRAPKKPAPDTPQE